MNTSIGSVPPAIGRVRFSWSKSAWLWSHLIVAAAFLPGALSLERSVLAVILTYFTLCVGHSVGLHRGLIHRSFACSKAVQHALLALFVFTGLGGPRAWIRLHFVRDYWQNQGECPVYFAYRHGLLRDFAWNLHTRFEPDAWERYRIPNAIERDVFVRCLERTWWIANIASYFVLWLVMGFEAAIVCGVARVAGGIVGHWFIGYWTHKHGERRFVVEGATEHGSNSRFLGWISFGEGFHNNHHALPNSARMGFARGEFDLGWVTVRALEALRLVEDVRSWSRGNAEWRGRPAVGKRSETVPLEDRQFVRQ